MLCIKNADHIRNVKGADPVCPDLFFTVNRYPVPTGNPVVKISVSCIVNKQVVTFGQLFLILIKRRQQVKPRGVKNYLCFETELVSQYFCNLFRIALGRVQTVPVGILFNTNYQGVIAAKNIRRQLPFLSFGIPGFRGQKDYTRSLLSQAVNRAYNHGDVGLFNFNGHVKQTFLVKFPFSVIHGKQRDA